MAKIDIINKYEECTVINKNVSVNYQCIDNVQTTINKEIPIGTVAETGAIAAGVGGGVVLAFIAVVVIYRIKRSKYGKRKASSSNENKAFDDLQNDDKSQQKHTLSDSTSQDKTAPTNSTLNIPEQLDQDGQESADLYNISNGDGTYDVSNNDSQRGNPNDDNIYSHTADNIYDSGSHHQSKDRNEETYDHFFGQQTEDEYDTTART